MLTHGQVFADAATLRTFCDKLRETRSVARAAESIGTHPKVASKVASSLVKGGVLSRGEFDRQQAQRLVKDSYGSGGKTARQIAAETGLPITGVYRVLSLLVGRGEIVRTETRGRKKVMPDGMDPLDTAPTDWDIAREVRSGRRCQRCHLTMPCSYGRNNCELGDSDYLKSPEFERMIALISTVFEVTKWKS